MALSFLRQLESDADLFAVQLNPNEPMGLKRSTASLVPFESGETEGDFDDSATAGLFDGLTNLDKLVDHIPTAVPTRKVEVECNFDIDPLIDYLSRACVSDPSKPTQDHPLLKRFASLATYYCYPHLDQHVDVEITNLPIYQQHLSHTSTSFLHVTADTNDRSTLHVLIRRKAEWQAALLSSMDSLLYGSDTMDYFYVIPEPKKDSVGEISPSFQFIRSAATSTSSAGATVTCVIVGASKAMFVRLQALGALPHLLKPYSDPSIPSSRYNSNRKQWSSAGAFEEAIAGYTVWLAVHFDVKVAVTVLMERIFSPSNKECNSGSLPYIMSPWEFSHSVRMFPRFHVLHVAAAARSNATAANTGSDEGENNEHEDSSTQLQSNPPMGDAVRATTRRIEVTGLFTGDSLAALCQYLLVLSKARRLSSNFQTTSFWQNMATEAFERHQPSVLSKSTILPSLAAGARPGAVAIPTGPGTSNRTSTLSVVFEFVDKPVDRYANELRTSNVSWNSRRSAGRMVGLSKINDDAWLASMRQAENKTPYFCLKLFQKSHKLVRFAYNQYRLQVSLNSFKNVNKGQASELSELGDPKAATWSEYVEDAVIAQEIRWVQADTPAGIVENKNFTNAPNQSKAMSSGCDDSSQTLFVVKTLLPPVRIGLDDSS